MGSDLHTFLNRDIWLEIIRTYRFDQSDNESTRKTKKAALQSLALVSSHLTVPAQSELWRTVRSIRHVVKYITDVEASNVVDTLFPRVRDSILLCILK